MEAIAQSKARASQAADKLIEAGAVTLDQGDHVLAVRCLKLDSDYGATAAIASAMLAIHGLPSGAGHLRQFVPLNTLLDHSMVKPHHLHE
jgi:hypothetical protein